MWFAALWRGVPGADLSVVIINNDHHGGEGGDGSKEAGGSSKSSDRSTTTGGQVEVEIKEDVSGVFVRSSSSSSNNGGNGKRGEDGHGNVSEGAIRRVGFEVGEWIRGW